MPALEMAGNPTKAKNISIAIIVLRSMFNNPPFSIGLWKTYMDGSKEIIELATTLAYFVPTMAFCEGTVLI
jgi:hypothetical protein